MKSSGQLTKYSLALKKKKKKRWELTYLRIQMQKYLQMLFLLHITQAF